jgi:hypothetical protein
MPDNIKPIEVSPSTGAIDTAAAAFRYLVVILGALPLLLQLLGQRDLIGLIAYFQSTDGASVAAAISALVALSYGLLKTFRRGAQVVQIASDPRVPDRVAKVTGS